MLRVVLLQEWHVCAFCLVFSTTVTLQRGVLLWCVLRLEGAGMSHHRWLQGCWLFIRRACENLRGISPDPWSLGNLFIFKETVFLALSTRAYILPSERGVSQASPQPGAVARVPVCLSVSSFRAQLFLFLQNNSFRSQRHRMLWPCLDALACTQKQMQGRDGARIALTPGRGL